MSRELEQQVIGTLLRNPDYIVKVNISANDFSDPFCVSVLTAMRNIAADGKTVDAFIVNDRMGGEVLGDVMTLWQECISHPSNLDGWCEKLRVISLGKSMGSLLETASKSLKDGKNPNAIRARLLTLLSTLDEGQKSYSHSSKQVMQQVTDYLQSAFDAREHGGLVGVTSGLSGLDSILGGFHHSDLIVVGARPGMGKTAFMASVARSAALNGKRVGIASTEMPAVQIGLRMVSMIGDISGTKLRSCDLDEQEFTRLTTAATQYSELPIEVYDKPACTPGDIALQARAWQLSGGLDLLIVDYLTRLVPDEADGNRTREVGKMIASLKTLAKTLNIPVICLAQLSRTVEQRTDKRPIMSDLRDSGEIEQEADSIMFLYRDAVYNPDADEQKAEILVEKNRHGPCGAVIARFIPEQMLWTNVGDESWNN